MYTFFLVLYVLFTLLHTLVKVIEKASSCAVFSQIKPRYVTSNLRYSVYAPYSIERNSHTELSLNSWLDSDLDLYNAHITKEVMQGENQLQQVGVTSASTPFLLPLGSWASLGFAPATAEDGASSGEPINDAPHQPKDPPEWCSLQERPILDVSALVLTSHGLKNETKIGISLFLFSSKEGRMLRNCSLFSLKKMQSVS